MPGKGKPFEKGNTLGEGRPPIPQWLRNGKKLLQADFLEVLQNLSQLTVDEIKELSKDGSLPANYAIMANWLAAACNDDRSRQTFFDRLYGKVTEKVEVSTPKPFVIKRSDGTEVVLGAKLEKEES